MERMLGEYSHSYHGSGLDAFKGRDAVFKDALKQELASETDLQKDVEDLFPAWVMHRLSQTWSFPNRWAKRKQFIEVALPSSGYVVFIDVSDEPTRNMFVHLEVASSLSPHAGGLPRKDVHILDVPTDMKPPMFEEAASSPTEQHVRVRLRLIPQLLKELFTKPFRNTTLVKRDHRIFVIEKGANLTGVDLSGTDLRYADLRGANLEGAILDNADLENADLSGAILRGVSLKNANLVDANLDEADLDGANLQNAKGYIRASW